MSDATDATDASDASTRPTPPPAGLLPHADPGLRCGDCAWRYLGGRGRPVGRCRQSVAPGHGHGVRVHAGQHACARYEPELDAAGCRACGACCREGFHLVQVGLRDPVRRLHPQLLECDDFGWHIPRPGGSCLALRARAAEGPAYTCTIYGDRPRACRDFEAASEACLIARRRVGLSA